MKAAMYKLNDALSYFCFIQLIMEKHIAEGKRWLSISAGHMIAPDKGLVLIVHDNISVRGREGGFKFPRVRYKVLK